MPHPSSPVDDIRVRPSYRELWPATFGERVSRTFGSLALRFWFQTRGGLASGLDVSLMDYFILYIFCSILQYHCGRFPLLLCELCGALHVLCRSSLHLLQGGSWELSRHKKLNLWLEICWITSTAPQSDGLPNRVRKNMFIFSRDIAKV